jgi:hypothetical protein
MLGASLWGSKGSNPAMSATQIVILFVLTVLLTMLSFPPESLIATVNNFANEGSLMMSNFVTQCFQPITAVLAAISSGCMANGKIPV